MKPATVRSLQIPKTISEAVDGLAASETVAEIMAGATWIMRADLRGEGEDRHYLAIGHLPGLQSVEIAADKVAVGACVTHAKLAREIGGIAELAALATAAGKSANPAVRNVATVGGNICAVDFAAADLVPALLCLGATVEWQTAEGIERADFATFLERRRGLRAKAIVTRITVPRSQRRSAHIRLPLRKAGDYPVAIVSMSASSDTAGRIEDPVIAVGSVEAAARRWRSLEDSLHGRPFDAEYAALKARELSGEFHGREGVEAPGWYRVQVLPALVRRGIEALQK